MPPDPYITSSSSSSEYSLDIDDVSTVPLNTVNTSNYTFKKYKCTHKEYYVNYYIDTTSSNTIKKIIIFGHYRNEDIKLPLSGWFHRCLYCNAITGRDMFYIKYNYIDIYIHYCNKCSYNIKKNSKTILPELETDIKAVVHEIQENAFL